MENQEKIVKEILDSPLIDPRFNLSIRALNCLKAADVETVRDLVSHTKNDLLKFRNFGRLSLTELEELVSGLNLTFGMKFESDESGKEIAIKVIKEPGFEKLDVTDKLNLLSGNIVKLELGEILVQCIQDVSDIAGILNEEPDKDAILEKLALSGNKTALKLLLQIQTQRLSFPRKNVLENFLRDAENHSILPYQGDKLNVKYSGFKIISGKQDVVSFSCEILFATRLYDSDMYKILRIGHESPIRAKIVDEQLKEWLLEQGYELNVANPEKPHLRKVVLVDRTSSKTASASYQIEIRKIKIVK